MTETTDLDQAPAQAGSTPVIPDTATRQLPWSGVTTANAGERMLTSAELIHEAGLDWTVAKRPLLRQMRNGSTPQSRAFEVYREDTEEELGQVKTHYQVYQNADAFAFGDSLVADGRARWMDAGMQSTGWRVFMAMMLTEPFTVLGEDEIRLYLFMRTSHDGSSAVSGFVTPIRFFCTNQIEAINDSALSRFKFQHTTNLNTRIEEAKLSFETAVNYQTAFTAVVESLAGVAVTDQEAQRYVDHAIAPRRGRRDGVIADIMHVYRTSPTVAPFHGNGYGLVNAVTEYFDHVIPSRTGNARFERIMAGEGARARNAVTQRVLALA